MRQSGKNKNSGWVKHVCVTGTGFIGVNSREYRGTAGAFLFLDLCPGYKSFHSNAPKVFMAMMS